MSADQPLKKSSGKGSTVVFRLLFASTAGEVVRKAACPVLTIRLPEKQLMMP